MRFWIIGPVSIAVLALSCAPAAAIKKGPYPEVKAAVSEPYSPDPAFETMRTAFADATARKDSAGLFSLVSPTFVWTVDNQLAADFDPGRDPLHNFKVVFGFRNVGKDTDGDVENGPFWDALTTFAQEQTFARLSDSNVVCTPITATIADEQTFAAAQKKIGDTEDDPVDWYFTLSETPVSEKPADTDPAIAKVGQVALPVIGTYPQAPANEPAPLPTHFEVLLASGKTGWIPASSARPLNGDHLCFAKTVAGAWKIAIFNQAE